tara:strand:+ start:164 stop:826 length:663 start_codon:yes stop_codon:yes gene_type:complete
MPYEELKKIGYKYIYYNGQKSYNGVAILSNLELKKFFSYDFLGKGEARHICGVTKENINFHNFYVPAGGDEPDPVKNIKFEYKLKYLEEMKKKFLEEDLKKTIILGDFNVAPLEEDVWSHKQLENVVSHTKVETDSLRSILKVCGFKDVIREHFQDIKLYSWWSYRARDWDKSNRGRRLDHLWASNDIAAAFLSCSIEREVRSWQPPSDHVPIIATLNLL